MSRPTEIDGLARQAKADGAALVVVHGETPVEPVAPGTNRAACISAFVDVLAHPGMIAMEDARAAADRGIALELTARGGHNRTNGHVARTALAGRVPHRGELGRPRPGRPDDGRRPRDRRARGRARSARLSRGT